jgi:hypothetical protein
MVYCFLVALIAISDLTSSSGIAVESTSGVLTGFVLDDSTEAQLRYAQVSVLRNNQDVTTEPHRRSKSAPAQEIGRSKANFIWDGLSPGSYRLRARHIGYLPQTIQTEVAPGETTVVVFRMRQGDPASTYAYYPQDSSATTAAEDDTPCLRGPPPYIFEDWDRIKDGGSIMATITSGTGITELLWWDCADGRNGPVHLGFRPGRVREGRIVSLGSDCEAQLIAALRSFADSQLPRHLQADLVAAVLERKIPTPAAEALLKSPDPVPLDAILAARMALELEKHKP